MKPFIAIVIIINTIFFGAMAYYSKLTYELTEVQTIVIKAGMDSTNIRLKSINTALDDKTSIDGNFYTAQCEHDVAALMPAILKALR